MSAGDTHFIATGPRSCASSSATSPGRGFGPVASRFSWRLPVSDDGGGRSPFFILRGLSLRT